MLKTSFVNIKFIFSFILEHGWLISENPERCVTVYIEILVYHIGFKQNSYKFFVSLNSKKNSLIDPFMSNDRMYVLTSVEGDVTLHSLDLKSYTTLTSPSLGVGPRVVRIFNGHVITYPDTISTIYARRCLNAVLSEGMWTCGSFNR